MRKETITYTDYNGEERTEDYYFNLSDADIIKLELTTKGGIESYITKIINERKQKKLTKLFCKVLKLSYGVKTLDGGFDKDPALFKKFETTEAYSVLFTRLATDTDFASEFINGIMPKAKQAYTPQDHKLPAAEQAKLDAKKRLQVIQGKQSE